MPLKIEACTTTCTHSRVRVEERGKKAVILNDDRIEFSITRIDGCVITNETACDYVVSREGAGQVFIELKGRNVAHAARQVLVTTAEFARQREITGPKLGALIVSSQYPSHDTAVRKAQEEYAKRYRAPLKVATGNREYDFDRLVEFG